MNLLNFIRLCANSIYNNQNVHGSKLLTGLRLGLSHLYKHAFSHHFQYTLNILCACGKDVESITFFSLHCTNFYISRQTPFQNVRSIGEQILSQSETDNSNFSLWQP